ncbi:MAG: autotransporter-associated beta strand repeat-containing protein, partial [Prosthecobacter sp.]|nr:autotransporter-associated beta strand repeat-containing protein [Prosthecobacter sp.]
LRTASASGTYNHEVVIAENVPMARIDLNRSSGSSSGTITIPALTILGTDGAAGTLLQIENQNSYNFNVSGNTMIGGSSPVGIRVNTGTATLNSTLTSLAPITKTGNGTLRMNGVANAYAKGFTLNRGEWYTVSNTAEVAGSGNVVSNFGNIRMGNTSASTGVRFNFPNQTLTINGQTTLITQRVGSTAANISIGAANNGNVLRTNNSPWVIFQAASYGDQINLYSNVVINDAPWLRIDSAFTLFRTGSVLSGDGKLNKAGNQHMGFDNNAANTYSGGTDIWAGELQIRQANATLGTGAVRLYPGAVVATRGAASLGTTGLTQILTSGSAFPVVSTRGTAASGVFNDAFNSTTAAAAASAILGNGNGIIAIGGGGTLSIDPALATRDGGVFANWWLGASEGGGTYSANSIAPWGTSLNEFRVGGAHNGTTTLNPATGGSDQLSGAGNRLIIGGGQNVMGYGTVTISSNANNTFGGGTLVTRTRDVSGAFRGAPLSIQGGQTGATTYRTPLGTGTVDVFGEIRIEGSTGTARNADSANANEYVFHPGSRIRFDNGTAFSTVGTEGRWADSTGMILNASVVEIFGAGSNNAYNQEIIGDLTIKGGSEVVLRRRTTNWAELDVGNITRSGNGTLMIT